jgi:hypothetical protein
MDNSSLLVICKCFSPCYAEIYHYYYYYYLLVAEGWLENQCEKRQGLKIQTKPQFWMKILPKFGLCAVKTVTVGYLLSWKMKQSNLKMLEHMKVKWKKLQKA